MKSGTKLAIAVVAAVGMALAYQRLGLTPEPPGTEPDTTRSAAPPAATTAPPALTVYFSRGDTSVAVSRTPPPNAAGPEAALRALLAGPSAAEQERGISSWFSPETANQLGSFRIDELGTAHVDFVNLAQVIPSASASAGSELLLRELNTTLFQYPEIQAIAYTIGGSCEAFWNWLQYDCETVRRPAAPQPPR